jgi:hypothetical protein
MTWRTVSVLAGAGLVCALAACSPGYSDEPIPVEPGIGDGSGSAACAAAFPDPLAGPDLSVTPTVPADFPAPPPGAELCVAYQTSEDTAVLQYVTTLQPDAVLDYYEPALSGYELVRGVGIGDQPILNATGQGLEFAIQTDAGTRTYVIAFSAA